LLIDFRFQAKSASSMGKLPLTTERHLFSAADILRDKIDASVSIKTISGFFR